MKIKAKIIYVLAGMLFLLFLWAVVLFRFYTLKYVIQLEEESNYHYSTLVRNAVKNELDWLATLANDWAYWNDLYHFMQQPNEAFRHSNLRLSALHNISVDILLIVQPDGTIQEQVVTEQAAQWQTKSLLTPTQNTLLDIKTLFSNKAEQGVFTSNIGLVALASSPVYRSDGSGKQAGYLLIGRILPGTYIDNIIAQFDSQIDISIESVPAQMEPEITLTSKVMTISTYLPLKNAPNSSIKASIERPRTLFTSASSFTWEILTVILLSTIFIGLLVYVLLEKIIIKPLGELEANVKRFEQHHELPPVTCSRTDDEIGELGRILHQIGFQVKDTWAQLRAERNDYLKASNTDPLTKLWNRRYVEQTLTQQDTWSQPDNWLFMMVDIDHFKQINDNFGHDAGDIAIKQMASVLRYLSRTDDIVMRYGGEEFALICRGVDERVGRVIAERVRSAIESRRFGHKGASFKTTCSIGFFTLWVDDSEKATTNWRDMLKVADMALYAAKNSGRNRWVGAKSLYSVAIDRLPSNGKRLQYAIDHEQMIIMQSEQSEQSDKPLSWN